VLAKDQLAAHRAVSAAHQSRWKFFGDAEDDETEDDHDEVRSIASKTLLEILCGDKDSPENSIHSDCALVELLDEHDDLEGETERNAAADRAVHVGEEDDERTG
jgi:hypothetical protein